MKKDLFSALSALHDAVQEHFTRHCLLVENGLDGFHQIIEQREVKDAAIRLDNKLEQCLDGLTNEDIQILLGEVREYVALLCEESLRDAGGVLLDNKSYRTFLRIVKIIIFEYEEEKGFPYFHYSDFLRRLVMW